MKRKSRGRWLYTGLIVLLMLAAWPGQLSPVRPENSSLVEAADPLIKEKEAKPAGITEAKPAGVTEVMPDGITEAELKDPAPESGIDGNRLVVELEQGTDAAAIAKELGATVVRQGPLDFATLELPAGDVTMSLEKARSLPGVEGAELSQRVQTAETGQRQVSGTNVTETKYKDQWGLARIQAAEAWDSGATGQGITIAIVDTGIDLNHPDLKNNLVPGYNAITGQTGPAAQDDNGHGTHVAGIAAAGLNGIGVVGTAYEAKLMPIKTMDKNGEGTDDVIADGIIWAVDHGAQIINLSLGAESESEILKQAVDYATERGSLVIAAAGNHDPAQGGVISYPATDPKVLAVTATDEYDLPSAFSAIGPEAELAAPGDYILSTYWSTGGSGYAYLQGTSMATPFVSGTAALVWSQHPDWSAQEVRVALEDGAQDLGQPGRDNYYGYGLLDAYSSLSYTSAPTSYTSPAYVPASGGVVSSGDGVISSTLAVPAGSFEDNTQVVLQSTLAPADFPAEIMAGSSAFSVSWDEQEAPQHYMNLTVEAQKPAYEEELVGYVYRWSDSRWIPVGGGASGSTVSVNISEPGTYRVGYTPLSLDSRLAGKDRLETAVAISQAGYPHGTDTVILARADDFPDALAGVPLAYKEQAPILLTNPQSLSPAVQEELERLAPQKIILLGGTGAISQEIEDELKGIATVERIGGQNRYDTAAQIARAVGTSGEAVVVNGSTFPDALAISSQAAQQGQPILLTPANKLDSATEQALRELNVTETLVVGGEGVVSAEVYEALPNPSRLAGANRYETAAAVFEQASPDAAQFYVATGENFPDALAGGALAAMQGTDILLVPPSGATAGQQEVLSAWSGRRATALGGVGAVSEEAMGSVRGVK